MIKYYTKPTGFLSANSHLIVDTDTGESAIFDVGAFDENLQRLLSNTDISKLRYIILTHRHYDHVAGTEELRRRTGAKVLISDKDKTGLYDEEDSLARKFRMPLLKCTDFEVISDGDEIPFGNTHIRVMATPGHTSGGLSFIVGDILITGDTLFAGTVGRTDLKSSSSADMQKSIDKLKALDKNYTVLTGHGENTDLEHEKKYNPFFN